MIKWHISSDLMDFADFLQISVSCSVFSLCSDFFSAAHFVLTSTTIAVITSTLINLGIIAETLNP